MTEKISRRAFIKGGVAAACALAVPGAAGRAAASEGGSQLATLIDVGKCIGCGACVQACRESNAAKYPEPKKPFPRMFPERVKAEDWSGRRDEEERLTPYNWLFIQHATVTRDGKEIELTLPRRCMHCVNPPCVKLCPWGAARQLENGVSVIDSGICLGGSKCSEVCPWRIPQRQTGVGLYLDILPAFAGNGVMYKCDRCHDRIARGELPACIEACPEEVQSIGPRGEIVIKALSRCHLPIEIRQFGRRVFFKSRACEPMDIHRANQGLEAFRAAMESAAYDLIVLDEINMAVDFGLLKFEQVEELLMHKPKELHVILTGRNAPQQLVQMADMVTEMTEVKHHYRQGIQAQKGIEF